MRRKQVEEDGVVRGVSFTSLWSDVLWNDRADPVNRHFAWVYVLAAAFPFLFAMVDPKGLANTHKLSLLWSFLLTVVMWMWGHLLFDPTHPEYNNGKRKSDSASGDIALVPTANGAAATAASDDIGINVATASAESTSSSPDTPSSSSSSSPLISTVVIDNVSVRQLKLVRFVAFVLLIIAVPLYFTGSNVALHSRFAVEGRAMLYDDVLLRMDEMLLGWLFPRGQLALWLDTNEFVGGRSWISPFYVDVLQVMYASYYLWGNAFAVWLMYKFWVGEAASGDVRDDDLKSAEGKLKRTIAMYERTRLTSNQLWRRVCMFVTAWVSTYLFNFALNIVFPAVSPRIYLASDYTNELNGLLFTRLIRGALTKAAANSYSAFPSGHCGLSWLAAYASYRMGYEKFGRIAGVAAVLITSATQVLRYHYFVDMVFAIALLACGALAGNLSSAGEFYSTLHYRVVRDKQ
eukprot:TRINITY_DN60129_c0_g1_i1.p1 TRINITY_DN60129_c0_g1~~TRINITY_DN60129_c0_g1_i1.p1  ORF type:complete len:462 (+),score=176.61 TRINITY_DN60129_c0_g1_i1:8-1393(+)